MTHFADWLQDPSQGAWFSGLFEGGVDGARDLDPIAHVRADAPPFLHMHGKNDGLVPFEQSLRLHEALQRVGASSELVLVDGADHCFIPQDPTSLMDHAVAFLRRHLS